ncbi:hypothetical protein BC938DRAFT_483902 [Jimgerdemannia flammicorona]|nr:hypothetical protein BC938DRAFT_483902 [Jimgerdemannia flammicorona]
MEFITAKALELFLQSLIDTACEETRARSGKRLSVAHLTLLPLRYHIVVFNILQTPRSHNLRDTSAPRHYSKKTILTTDQFDFLKDVVENVPDPSEATGTNIAEDGKTAVVGDSNSSNSSGSNSGVQPRRRERKGGEGSSTGAGVGRGRGKRR